MTDLDPTRLAAVPRELLERFALTYHHAQDPRASSKRETRLEDVYITLKEYLTPPPRRTRAEVDAEIVGIIRTVADSCEGSRLFTLCAEPVRDDGPPAREPITDSQARQLELLHALTRALPRAAIFPAGRLTGEEIAQARNDGRYVTADDGGSFALVFNTSIDRPQRPEPPPPEQIADGMDDDPAPSTELELDTFPQSREEGVRRFIRDEDKQNPWTATGGYRIGWNDAARRAALSTYQEEFPMQDESHAESHERGWNDAIAHLRTTGQLARRAKGGSVE